MDTAEILIKVKRALRMDDFQDEPLTELIEQVKADMVEMGVSEMVVNSNVSVGAITKGVWDKDNLHEYSSDFEKQIIRLREKGGE